MVSPPSDLKLCILLSAPEELAGEATPLFAAVLPEAWAPDAEPPMPEAMLSSLQVQPPIVRNLTWSFALFNSCFKRSIVRFCSIIYLSFGSILIDGALLILAARAA